MKRRTLMLGGATIVASSGRCGGILAAATYRRGRRDIRLGRALISSAAAHGPSPWEKLPGAALPGCARNCVATVAQTFGPLPCQRYPGTSGRHRRKGWAALRLAVRIVHAADCRPVENADIEIWHTDHRGIYSGREAADMCTLDDAEAISGLAFRGRQLTDAAGQASFLTVYPGWYRGRTPHVHCRIIVEGRELLVSQIYFDDALSDIVYGGHPDYRQRPPPRYAQRRGGPHPARTPSITYSISKSSTAACSPRRLRSAFRPEPTGARTFPASGMNQTQDFCVQALDRRTSGSEG